MVKKNKYKDVEIELKKTGWYVASIVSFDKSVGIYYKNIKADTMEGIKELIDQELKQA